jgi:hypothetical protein
VVAATPLAPGSATGTGVGEASAIDEGPGSELTGDPTTADGEGRALEPEQLVATIVATRTEAAARIMAVGS